MKTKSKCEFCGKEYDTGQYNKRYCDYDCADKMHVLKSKLRTQIRAKYYNQYKEQIENELKETLKKEIEQEQNKSKEQGGTNDIFIS